MDQIESGSIADWINSAGEVAGQPQAEYTEQGAGLEERPPTRWEQATRMLRWIGGLTLSASAVVFVSQRWDAMDSVMRYYSFLGFTGVLAAIGLFCGLVLKESKGARTLLALSAAFLPAHFAQIGALIHSQYGDIFPAPGSMMIMLAPSAAMAFQVLGLALIVLIPIAYLGFSSMARSAALRLTAIYLLSNAVLLVPVRQPDQVAVYGAILFGLLMFLDRLCLRLPALRTFDGRAVRGMLFVPVAVIALRNIISYDTTALFAAFTAAALGTALLHCPEAVRPAFLRPALRFIGNLLLILGWFSFIDGLFFSASPLISGIEPSLLRQLYFPLFLLPIAGYQIVHSLGGFDGDIGQRKLAVRLAISVSVLNLIIAGGLASALVCLIVSIAALIGAFTMEERVSLFGGGVGLLASLIFYIHFAWQMVEVSPWLVLAVIGTGTVVISSYIERSHQRIFEHFIRFKTRISSWA